jgi:hypothetical protein
MDNILSFIVLRLLYRLLCYCKRVRQKYIVYFFFRSCPQGPQLSSLDKSILRYVFLKQLSNFHLPRGRGISLILKKLKNIFINFIFIHFITFLSRLTNVYFLLYFKFLLHLYFIFLKLVNSKLLYLTDLFDSS